MWTLFIHVGFCLPLLEDGELEKQMHSHFSDLSCNEKKYKKVDGVSVHLQAQ